MADQFELLMDEALDEASSEMRSSFEQLRQQIELRKEECAFLDEVIADKRRMYQQAKAQHEERIRAIGKRARRQRARNSRGLTFGGFSPRLQMAQEDTVAERQQQHQKLEATAGEEDERHRQRQRLDETAIGSSDGGSSKCQLSLESLNSLSGLNLDLLLDALGGPSSIGSYPNVKCALDSLVLAAQRSSACRGGGVAGEGDADAGAGDAHAHALTTATHELLFEFRLALQTRLATLHTQLDVATIFRTFGDAGGGGSVDSSPCHDDVLSEQQQSFVQIESALGGNL